jgi:hypothetical protein
MSQNVTQDRVQRVGTLAASIIYDQGLSGHELLSLAALLMEHALRQAGSPLHLHMLKVTTEAIAERLLTVAAP